MTVVSATGAITLPAFSPCWNSHNVSALRSGPLDSPERAMHSRLLMTIYFAAIAFTALQTSAADRHACPDDDVLARYGQNELDTEQLTALANRPATISDLLRNLKVIFDQDLLVQPALFEEATLASIFDATVTQVEDRGDSRTVHLRSASQDVVTQATSRRKCVAQGKDGPLRRYRSGFLRLDIPPSADLSAGEVRSFMRSENATVLIMCNPKASLDYSRADSSPRFAVRELLLMTEPASQDDCKPFQTLADDARVVRIHLRWMESDPSLPSIRTDAPLMEIP